MRTLLRDHGDTALALALTALMQAELWLSSARADDRRVLAPLALGIGVALLARRRAPLPALAVGIALNTVGNAVQTTDEDPILLVGSLLVLVYSVGAHTAGRAAWVGAGLVALGIAGALAQDPEPADFGGLVFFTIVIGGPWVAGRAIRVRREREHVLVAERDERARAAVAEERLRIARELHDVVAHAIGVVVLQARGARRVLDTDPTEARHALDEIEATSTRALGEMRRLLGLLRETDEDASLAPSPSVRELDALAASVRESGLPVDVVVEGEERPLPAAVDLSAFRIVQEALTNALKHAGDAHARVVVRYADDALELEVVDDGADAGGDLSGGHGILGMRERVAMLGGDLRAGPRAAGGFCVAARLPL